MKPKKKDKCETCTAIAQGIQSERKRVCGLFEEMWKKDIFDVDEFRKELLAKINSEKTA